MTCLFIYNVIIDICRLVRACGDKYTQLQAKCPDQQEAWNLCSVDLNKAAMVRFSF